jgi:pyrimidine operon attenuation protein/uracil phosphoribosyltransferase
MSDGTVMSPDEVRRAVARIAHEIVEQNAGCQDLMLVGMRTRGVPLAQRIAAAIREFEGEEVPVGALDIGLYRDDLPARGTRVEIKPSELPEDIADKRVVLVDDVLYTGRSIRAALDALIDYGRPQRIQLAVLVDRGHRELPIRADFVGKNIPTAGLRQSVTVLLEEVDGFDEVRIVDSPERSPFLPSQSPTEPTPYVLRSELA